MKLNGFRSVEVAEFSPDQVKSYIHNWLSLYPHNKNVGKLDDQLSYFMNILQSNDDFRELIVTPLLLNLMCLVYCDNGEIYPDESWLYDKGVDLLLDKWNMEKQINDWEIGAKEYQKLKIEEKKKLLYDLAIHKLLNPNDFILFKQEDIIERVKFFF